MWVWRVSSAWDHALSSESLWSIGNINYTTDQLLHIVMSARLSAVDAYQRNDKAILKGQG